MLRVYAVTTGLLLSCLSMADDRLEWTYRYLRAVDTAQTTFFLSTRGHGERNPLLRTEPWQAALRMLVFTEGTISLARRSRYERQMLTALTVYQFIVVVDNHRLGPDRHGYVPLLSLRF